MVFNLEKRKIKGLFNLLLPKSCKELKIILVWTISRVTCCLIRFMIASHWPTCLTQDVNFVPRNATVVLCIERLLLSKMCLYHICSLLSFVKIFIIFQLIIILLQNDFTVAFLSKNQYYPIKTIPNFFEVHSIGSCSIELIFKFPLITKILSPLWPLMMLGDVATLRIIL